MAALKMSDIKIDEESKEVKILLSASKNDPQAKGAERPWKCICDEGTLAHITRCFITGTGCAPTSHLPHAVTSRRSS